MQSPRQASNIAPDPILSQAQARPQHTACIELATGRRWTYADLDADVQRAVNVLRARGVGAGDRVAVVAANSVYLLVLHHALLRLAAVFVPLNWRLSRPELETLLADCTPRLLYYETDLPGLPDGCTGLTLNDFKAEVRRTEPETTRTPNLRSSRDPCMILYTSGTSGTPKGVILTSACLLATAINFSVLGEVDSASVFLCDSPMFHVIGIVTQVWPPLLQGATMAISPGFKPDTTNARLANVQGLGVTHYFCVPQMADALRHAPGFEPRKWTRLKALFTGGAPNPPARILWWLDQGVKMVDGYGMTETGTTLGMPLSVDMIRAKAGSVGFPGPLTQVRIVDPNGRAVPDGVPGEIQVSGMAVTPGYWERPQETDRAFASGGWIRTGDVAQRDADGFIFIVDRLKDMYISGGENVYPTEVEAALVRHPGVREVAVVGVPDKKWGETGAAFVVAAEELDHETFEAQLSGHCQELLAKFKVPTRFVVVDKLPRTGSGKVLKHVLKAQLRPRKTGGPSL